MAAIRFEETDDIIDICQDNVFKAVFTKDSLESGGALAGLLMCFTKQKLSVFGSAGVTGTVFTGERMNSLLNPKHRQVFWFLRRLNLAVFSHQRSVKAFSCAAAVQNIDHDTPSSL